HKIDDEFFTYKAVMNAKKIVTISQRLCLYRMRESGVMLSYDAHEETMIQDRLEYLTERYELVSKKYKELKSDYLDNLQDNLIRLKRESYWYQETHQRVKTTMKQYLREVIKSDISWKKKYSFIRGFLCEEKQKSENKNQQKERELFK
ncbi:MAG: glycosyltransferase, partial [Anaerostipes sp.]|nr:glycosyltransferase [Anaerostipes sp.]